MQPSPLQVHEETPFLSVAACKQSHAGLQTRAGFSSHSAQTQDPANPHSLPMSPHSLQTARKQSREPTVRATTLTPVLPSTLRHGHTPRETQRQAQRCLSGYPCFLL